MKFVIVALAALIAVCAAQSDEDWERYQKQYSKNYRSADEVSSRRAAWEKNWKLIKDHNEKYAKGETTFTLGENQYADMTYDEFSKQILGLDGSLLKQKHNEEHAMSGRELRSFQDHRQNGWITNIKDQGKCGGCWAFATAAAVETLFIRTKSYDISTDLSEQHMIDCSKGLLLGFLQRNKGCSGGQLAATFDDMAKIGITYESNYPYTATDGTCRTQSVVNKISGSVACSTEKAILDAVAQGHAVTVGIHASERFQLYKGGVYVSNKDEDAAGANHAVLVIGYDLTRTGEEVYIIKNSWNTSWGENGYIRLIQGRKAIKIDTMACYPKA